MSKCYHCIMANSDSPVLFKPTIYIIEGDYYEACHRHSDKSEPEEEFEQEQQIPT